jgi:hypothetical protein
MPIPLDAKQVVGQPNRIELATGDVVTRHQALNLGASFMGYRNHADYRDHTKADDKYVEAWLRTRQGQEALKQEKTLTKNEGGRFNNAKFKQRVIAMRNGRPHPKKGKGPGSAYVDFMTRYGFSGGADFVRY